MWIYLLLLVSPLILIIVALAIQTRSGGQVPACLRCTTTRRRYLGALWGAWLLVIVLFVVAIPLESGLVWSLWFLLVLIALVAMGCSERTRVRGFVNDDVRWITLQGADPAFAALVADAVQGRPAATAPASAELRASVAGSTILPRY